MIPLCIDDFETPFRQAYLDLALEKGNKEEYFQGAYVSWAEWRSPTDSCGFDAFMEALRIVHSDEVILSRTPYDHCVETLQELVDEGHELLYVTTRASKCHDATEGWLQEWQFPEGDLICTNENKSPHIRHCKYLIDDRPRTVCDFVYDFNWKLSVGSENEEMARKAFVKSYAYNQNLTDIKNVYVAPTWRGIRLYLMRTGLLKDDEKVQQMFAGQAA